MGNFALVFPVLPGKGDAEVKKMAATFTSRPDEFRESRRRSGVTLERAYLQHTPMGNFVVAYLESTKGLAETMGSPATSGLDIDRVFAEYVKTVHGVDLTQPPAGPPPETIADWRDAQVTSRGRGMAFTAPLAPGKTDQGRAFVKEAFEKRAAEFAASRRALSQNVELITLQSTPMGDVVNVYIEGKDPFAGNIKFAASTSDFDVWFKRNLSEIFPPFIDFSKPVPGVEEFFDSMTLLPKA
jgi:hypothetical protein